MTTTSGRRKRSFSEPPILGLWRWCQGSFSGRRVFRPKINEKSRRLSENNENRNMTWPLSHSHPKKLGSLPGNHETIGIEPGHDSMICRHPLELGSLPSQTDSVWDSVHMGSARTALGHPGRARCHPPFAGEPRGAACAPDHSVELGRPWLFDGPFCCPLPVLHPSLSVVHQDKDDGNEDLCDASTYCGDDTSDTLSDAGSFLDHLAKVPAPRQARPLDASTTLPAAAPHLCMTRAAGNEENLASNQNSINNSSSNSIVHDTTVPSTIAPTGCPDDHLVAAGHLFTGNSPQKLPGCKARRRGSFR